MATYSNNTTIKISAKVSASVTGTSNTIYTVPANCYLDCWYINATGTNIGGVGVTVTLSIDGLNYSNSGSYGANVNFGPSQSSGVITSQPPLILGPGTVISYTNSGATSGNGQIKGTLFINTP